MGGHGVLRYEQDSRVREGGRLSTGHGDMTWLGQSEPPLSFEDRQSPVSTVQIPFNPTWPGPHALLARPD